MSTEITVYEELTWPEVAALPRALPVVIPLGPRQGLNLSAVVEAVAGRLGREPARLVILPGLPYGFQQAGDDLLARLRVRPYVLRRFLAGIKRSLRAQGFRNVFVAHSSPSISLDLPPSQAGRVALVVTGHTEQHGHHLPLNTDTVIVEAIGQGVANRLPDKVTRLPTLPYGVSMHRREFSGTLTVPGQVYEQFLLDLIRCLVRLGYDRLYLLNGHGGNHSFIVNVVKYAADEQPHIFCATEWLYLSGRKGAEAIVRHRQSVFPGGMGHAGELETSLILHLRPDLVKMERCVDETDQVRTPNCFIDWSDGSLIACPPWSDDTRTGSYGQGSLGTAEKGRLWLEVAIEEKVESILEVCQQAELRATRRGRPT